MKIKQLIFAAILAGLLTGCSLLMPKKVELFQDKVQAFPEMKEKEIEIQRQTAARAEAKAWDTFEAALSEKSPETVLKPAKETVTLTSAVSTFVGPPAKPAGTNISSESLANSAKTTVAKQNQRIEEFKEDNNKNAGKKIEGTGFVQMGYFTMWGIILAVLAVIVAGVKIYGMINPAVGLGTNVVGRVSSAVLKKGFAEISEGGEWFKQYVTESALADDVKKTVLGLFQRAHSEAQSRDVQVLIERLTQK